ncbi:2OG-Fe(II)-dependent halogenase WelO5 family protein [Streptomyces sp. Wh19]|uniref:2OG-Fe(II)-dependent halogenase WelO5 family protein n=1 Tax=Streptomyces sp. Wh19 TaxID=3076629 RepID=UPI0029586CEB|nr:hypothetical protein [Streptomyces sp. Wh19]MDV9199084.1 hypothetical protein [Streptomyces sp. Wh19]
MRESDATLMAGLASGEHAIVVLKGLFPEPVFSRNRDRIFTLFDQAITTTYSNGRLTTVGPYLAKFVGDRPSYFAGAAEAAATSAGAGIDLARHARERLAAILGLAAFEPAAEPDGTGYADHNIRIYQEDVATPLHNDNIMRDMAADNLVLKSLTSQYSCVICIQECDAGGSLELYRRGWTPDDERYKIPGGFGYDTAVVEGAEKVRFKPETGDVYLFDPTQYHAIEPSVGDARVTMGFFFGFRDAAPGEAIAWV